MQSSTLVSSFPAAKHFESRHLPVLVLENGPSAAFRGPSSNLARVEMSTPSLRDIMYVRVCARLCVCACLRACACLCACLSVRGRVGACPSAALASASAGDSVTFLQARFSYGKDPGARLVAGLFHALRGALASPGPAASAPGVDSHIGSAIYASTQ
eukprot:3114577-Pyramimonas_sp.AAC.1